MRYDSVMVLDPQVADVVARLKALSLPPIDKTTVAQRRHLVDVYYQFQGPKQPVAATQDITLPVTGGDLPVRLYTPEGPGPFPLVIFFHGGGWISGHIELYDQACRWLCAHSGAVVASVEYRMSPEHKFPGPLNDAYQAVQWLSAHATHFQADATRLAVAGDSSGGNLAAAVCLRARDEQGPAIRAQLLIYPVLDYNFTTPSYEEFAQGPLLTRGAMEACWAYYLADPAQGHTPYASPLRERCLTGLPDACILTAECDPVRDDGEQYAHHLQAAGVRVYHTRYAGATHVLLHMTGEAEAAREMMREAGRVLKEWLG